MKFKNLFASILFVIIFSKIIIAQVVEVTPQKPTFGDTLQISYFSNVEGAKFSANEEIYTAIWITYQNGSNIKTWRKLEKYEDRQLTKLLVEKMRPGIIFILLHYLKQHGI